MSETKEINKKGLAGPIGMTVLLGIVAMVVIVIGTIAFIGVEFQGVGSGPKITTLEFVTANNRAYIFSTLLTHIKLGDRSFLEHGIEIAYSSQKDAGSEKLGSDLGEFVGAYTSEDIRSIYVDIKKGGSTLFSYKNRVSECGDHLEGFCVDTNLERITCGVGRKRIDAMDYTMNQCNVGQICCIEDEPSYNNAQRCGFESKGICDIATRQNGNCLPGRVAYPSEPDECPMTSGVISSLTTVAKVNTQCCIAVKNWIL